MDGKTIKAYKAFDGDLKCRGFQYEVGKSYHEDGIKLCKSGFHACERIADCFKFYSFEDKPRVCEVECGGEIQREDGGSKLCCSDLTIVRELPWSEVLDLCNTGDCNTGNRNTGHGNTGNGNTGHGNTGDCNTGHFNTGDCNTGHFNTGDRNTGYFNTGNRNTGNRNTGHFNTGDCNTGDCNTGHFNTGDCNTGHFNTDEPTARMFNKDTGLKASEIRIPGFLFFELTVWVSRDDATDEEKEAHKQEIEACGGFLRTLDYKEAFKMAWQKASEEERESVKNLPNFDADIFFEISGIRVEG